MARGQPRLHPGRRAALGVVEGRASLPSLSPSPCTTSTCCATWRSSSGSPSRSWRLRIWVRLPPLVAFLLTGVVIGPSGAGLIPDPEAVSALSEIGVVLLLFAIGLEFSLSVVLRWGRSVLVAGGAQAGGDDRARGGRPAPRSGVAARQGSLLRLPRRDVVDRGGDARLRGPGGARYAPGARVGLDPAVPGPLRRPVHAAGAAPGRPRRGAGRRPVAAAGGRARRGRGPHRRRADGRPLDARPCRPAARPGAVHALHRVHRRRHGARDGGRRLLAGHRRVPRGADHLGVGVRAAGALRRAAVPGAVQRRLLHVDRHAARRPAGRRAAARRDRGDACPHRRQGGGDDRRGDAARPVARRRADDRPQPRPGGGVLLRARRGRPAAGAVRGRRLPDLPVGRRALDDGDAVPRGDGAPGRRRRRAPVAVGGGRAGGGARRRRGRRTRPTGTR